MIMEVVFKFGHVPTKVDRRTRLRQTRLVGALFNTTGEIRKILTLHTTVCAIVTLFFG